MVTITNQESLLVVCLTAAVCLGLMLWLYFSNEEPYQTVLVSPFSGGAPAPSSEQVYQVQVKDWVHGEQKFCPLLTGTGDECQALKKDLLKRGYSATDVRVVQLVGESA